MNKKIKSLKEEVFESFIKVSTGKEKNVKNTGALKKKIARELTNINMECKNGKE